MCELTITCIFRRRIGLPQDTNALALQPIGTQGIRPLCAWPLSALSTLCLFIDCLQARCNGYLHRVLVARLPQQQLADGGIQAALLTDGLGLEEEQMLAFLFLTAGLHPNDAIYATRLGDFKLSLIHI